MAHATVTFHWHSPKTTQLFTYSVSDPTVPRPPIGWFTFCEIIYLPYFGSGDPQKWGFWLWKLIWPRFYTVHLPTKCHHSTFNHSEVIVLANKQRGRFCRNICLAVLSYADGETLRDVFSMCAKGGVCACVSLLYTSCAMLIDLVCCRGMMLVCVMYVWVLRHCCLRSSTADWINCYVCRLFHSFCC